MVIPVEWVASTTDSIGADQSSQKEQKGQPAVNFIE